jgi:hypothetical protein
MISTVTLTIDATNKVGRVTDTTDYSSLGLSVSSFGAKGLGVIYFQGQQIVSKLDIGDPLIDLQAGDTFFEFPLELDVNGEIANGVYQIDYSLRVDTTEAGVDFGAGVTLPNTFDPGAAFQWLADYLQPGNSIFLYTPGSGDQDVTVATAEFVDPNMTITVNETITSVWSFFQVILTNLQSTTYYTYSGCVQSETVINFTYDCDVAPNGTFSVSNFTNLNGGTIISLNATINYPSWTSTTPTFNSQIVTTSLPYTNNVLATGTFGVSLSQVIENVQSDGLILQYTTSRIQEFNVSCVGSLCNLVPCIESLRNAHAAELQRNRISKYQVFVDNVLMYYAEAQNYRSCGEMDKYRSTLALLEAQLDASGCDCGCCDPDTYQWVTNNTTSTIDSLINAIQFRFVDGVPTVTDDETAGVLNGALWEDISGLPGTLGILYVCTDNTPGNAQWEVYYDPNEAPPGYDATDITYAGASLFPGPTNVAAALDITSGAVEGQALSINNLYVALGNTNAAVAGKLTANAPIVGGTRTKITYDTNGLVVAGSNLSASDIPSGVDAAKISTGTISNTEFNYLNGVSSNIQTQLNTKLPSSLVADTTLDYNNFILTLSTGTGQTDVVKAQAATSSAPALTVQARNAAAAAGFGSSIALSGNLTGNPTQVNMSTVRAYWTDASNGDSTFTVSTAKGETESVKMEISNVGQVKLNEYDSNIFVDSSPAYLLGVDASGNVVQAPSVPAGPTIYAGRVSGNGSGASLVQFGNTTGATLTLSNPGLGNFRITASSAIFNASKTVAFFQCSSVLTVQAVIITSSTVIDIYVYSTANTPQNIVDGAMIKIETYP